MNEILHSYLIVIPMFINTTHLLPSDEGILYMRMGCHFIGIPEGLSGYKYGTFDHGP